MRVLVSAVPAHGHVLPMAPLMDAALAAHHEVALTTSAGMASVVHDELPGDVELLPAGPMPMAFSLEGARRTGHDLMSPMDAETVGEIFGGARLDSSADAALESARAWRPDVVVTDVVDTVGPLIAAALGVGWHTIGITAGIHSTWLATIDRVAATRYTARGLSPTTAASYLDPWPPLLRDPDDDLSRGAPVHTIRTQPHRGTGRVELPTFSDPSVPTVLVTLGTVFSSTDTLTAVVDAVARPGINVLATLGLALDSRPVVGAERDDAAGEVRYVPFAPMEQLLERASVVVGVGGAGTVLAAASRGVPLVLWPQGAETPVVAERARAAGTSITVGGPAEIGAAVDAVLHDAAYRECARSVAAEIAEAAAPEDVLREVILPAR